MRLVLTPAIPALAFARPGNRRGRVVSGLWPDTVASRAAIAAAPSRKRCQAKGQTPRHAPPLCLPDAAPTSCFPEVAPVARPSGITVVQENRTRASSSQRITVAVTSNLSSYVRDPGSRFRSAGKQKAATLNRPNSRSTCLASLVGLPGRPLWRSSRRGSRAARAPFSWLPRSRCARLFRPRRLPSRKSGRPCH